MIIDQLTPTASDNLTDELAVEQGTSTFKTTWQKILDMFAVSAGTPAMDGTGSQGSANTLSRSDHVHPTDTSRLAKNGSMSNVNPVSDLNNFVTGIAIFDPAGNISNIPNTSTWWLIVGSGNGTNTATQVAYPLSSSYLPMERTKSSNTWSSWRPIGSGKKVTISLSTTWTTAGADIYSQAITISGTTNNTKVDLQPNAAVILQLANDGVTGMYVENNNGFTVYAVGAKPTAALSIQATYYEVV